MLRKESWPLPSLPLCCPRQVSSALDGTGHEWRGCIQFMKLMRDSPEGQSIRTFWCCSGAAHQRKLWSPAVCACRTWYSVIPCLQALQFKHQSQVVFPKASPHLPELSMPVIPHNFSCPRQKNEVTVKSIDECCPQSINSAIWDNFSTSQILSLGNAPVPAG